MNVAGLFVENIGVVAQDRGVALARRREGNDCRLESFARHKGQRDVIQAAFAEDGGLELIGLGFYRR